MLSLFQSFSRKITGRTHIFERPTMMQYLTSKTSLLTFVIILGLSLVFLWLKYTNGLASLYMQRDMWESNYEKLLKDFESYSKNIQVKKSKLNWHEVKEKKQLVGPIGWKGLPPMDKPDESEMHDKWIVLTTISKPTEDVIKLSKVKDWKVVVVADKKTPEPWE